MQRRTLSVRLLELAGWVLKFTQLADEITEQAVQLRRDGMIGQLTKDLTCNVKSVLHADLLVEMVRRRVIAHPALPPSTTVAPLVHEGAGGDIRNYRLQIEWATATL